jgi:hypothetical protein
VEVFEFVMTPGVTKNFGGSGTTFWKDTIYLFVLSGTQRGTKGDIGGQHDVPSCKFQNPKVRS